jgi:hypothetical protein
MTSATANSEESTPVVAAAPGGCAEEASPDASLIEEGEVSATAPSGVIAKPAKLGLIDRLEAFIARLSVKNRFWHRVCSMIWLPYAFRSGIRMKRVDNSTFAAELPFRRFNRNWYNAMAGAALLGNSEIAGGMYVFGVCGGEYTIVCKELSYKFLRPCFGPALYKISTREDVKALVAAGAEFNVTVDMDVMQQAVLPRAVGGFVKNRKKSLVAKMSSKDRRVGKVTAIFHVTPHAHHKAKRGHVRQVG